MGLAPPLRLAYAIILRLPVASVLDPSRWRIGLLEHISDIAGT
jgi:hypothetical protein